MICARLFFVCLVSVVYSVLPLHASQPGDMDGAGWNLPANFHELSSLQVEGVMPMAVLDGTPAAVRLEFSNPPLASEVVSLDGVDYIRIMMSGEGSSLDPGVPDLPRVTRLIMVENTGEIGLNITDLSYAVLPMDYPPAPAQPLAGDDESPLDGSVAIDQEIYSTDAWYPPQVAEIVGPATFRDIRFVVVVIHPVQVNPVTQEMRVYDRIEVGIDNLGGIGENELPIEPASLSPEFSKLYRQFENFPGSALDELPRVPGKQLFICGDNAIITNEVQKIVNWRRRKGIDAYYVTTTQSGATAAAIRNFISSEYNNSNGQLDFVTIVGDPDAGAPYGIPTDFSQLDNYFATMGGGNPDPIPDIAVGRLPITSSSQLNALIEKTIQYESDPFLTDTTWFTRAWCAAHTGQIQSNPAMKEYTRIIMLQHGMTTVNFDVFPGGINTTTLNTRINQGVVVFNHRLSWIGEMGSGDLSGIANGRKLPFVMAVTCATGTFDGGSALSEDWVRRGTAASPAGAIGCVGMSGIGTHVPYNNIVDAGAMFGLYVLGVREQGLALVEGKLQLYKNYAAVGHMGDVQNFSYWANLQGDPGVPIWLAVPRAPVVTRPTSVHRLTDNIAVTVTQGGNPVENALVGLVKGTETFARGYTNANGEINLPVSLPTTGYLHITVTHGHLDSYLDSIQVVSPAASLSFFSNTVDDDNVGGTIGDGNGVLNPGETIDLNLRLLNSGTSTTVTGISGTLTTPSPGIQIISGTQTYPNIAVGANSAPDAPFRIQVGAVFNGEPIPFFLTTTSSAGTQVIRVDLTPVAGDVTFVSSAFLDANSRLDPGETGNLTVTFLNSGSRSLTSANGILRSLDSHVIVNDSVGAFGTVNNGANGSNGGNPFNVSAITNTVGGYPASLQLVVTDANGFRDSANFVQTVGIATSITPTGPDAHGYYAYDNTETQPAGTASEYVWVEIAPGLGGPGTSLGFTDGGEDQDQVAIRTLPFDFTFYGQSFTQVTICTNGWLAFGSQTIDDFRNYHIGSPIGPVNQVAAYWDDLVVTGIANGGVYTWHDVSTSRYIVEWRTQTLWSDVNEVFQIILLDQDAYPSPTGDGKILVQYQDVPMSQNGGSNDNDYATLGIQNADHSVGLEYSYWNQYAPGAATMVDGRAIMYTTDISGLVPTTLTLMAPNGGEIWYMHTNSTVTWIGGDEADDVFIELSRNGLAGPWLPVIASTPNDGTHSFVVDGPASATCRMRISSVQDPGELDESSADFTISTINIVSPNGGETFLRDSSEVISWVGGDPGSNVMIELSRNGLTGPWTPLSASTPNVGTFNWIVTGPTASTCRVRVTSLSDPSDTGTSNADFSIQAIQVVMAEDFETGAPGWTHSSAGGQWLDQWHISTERSLSATHSYKCGDAAAGQYVPFNDARLTSPVSMNLPANATLEFAYQVEAEISGAFPDSAYDGGVVEISADGGAFQPVFPASPGYNKTFRTTAGGGNPFTGPMPGIPCYSGSVTVWTQQSVDLSPFGGQDIQIRFRFGSDQNTNSEGWYVDNVEVYAPLIVVEPTTPTGLTLYSVGTDLILRWAADSNTHYRIYSGSSPDNPAETLEGTSQTNMFIVPGGASATRRYYVVVGWDGN